MTIIHRTALVEYSTHQMYALVNDIARYPEFLPMCQATEVHCHTETEAEATLKIAKGAIKLDFATKNEMIPDQVIKIRLLRGPFKRLLGRWKFESLKGKACKVSLELEFEFASRVLAWTLGGIFNRLANTMLDAFCQRAVEVYGAGSCG